MSNDYDNVRVCQVNRVKDMIEPPWRFGPVTLNYLYREESSELVDQIERWRNRALQAEANSEPRGNGWNRIFSTVLVPSWRGGWIGVWDALVAAIKGEPRYEVARPYSMSMYVKAFDPKSPSFIQLEEGEFDTPEET